MFLARFVARMGNEQLPRQVDGGKGFLGGQGEGKNGTGRVVLTFWRARLRRILRGNLRVAFSSIRCSRGEIGDEHDVKLTTDFSSAASDERENVATTDMCYPTQTRLPRLAMCRSHHRLPLCCIGWKISRRDKLPCVLLRRRARQDWL